MHVFNSTWITDTEHALTDWKMPVNWSWSWRWSSFVEKTSSVQGKVRKPAEAQEWQRATRGHGRGRDVTLMRIELTKGIKDRNEMQDARRSYCKIWCLSSINPLKYYYLLKLHVHYLSEQSIIFRIISVFIYLTCYFVYEYIFLRIISHIFPDSIISRNAKLW